MAWVHSNATPVHALGHGRYRLRIAFAMAASAQESTFSNKTVGFTEAYS